MVCKFTLLIYCEELIADSGSTRHNRWDRLHGLLLALHDAYMWKAAASLREFGSKAYPRRFVNEFNMHLSTQSNASWTCLQRAESCFVMSRGSRMTPPGTAMAAVSTVNAQGLLGIRRQTSSKVPPILSTDELQAGRPQRPSLSRRHCSHSHTVSCTAQ